MYVCEPKNNYCVVSHSLVKRCLILIIFFVEIFLRYCEVVFHLQQKSVNLTNFSVVDIFSCSKRISNIKNIVKISSNIIIKSNQISLSKNLTFRGFWFFKIQKKTKTLKTIFSTPAFK